MVVRRLQVQLISIQEEQRNVVLGETAWLCIFVYDA